MKFFNRSIILFILFFSTLSVTVASEWGRSGHYITGEIAWMHLTDTAKAEVLRILGDDSIVEATVWMDQVRSTPDYRHTADWHWVTIHTGQTYEESEKNPNGDLMGELERMIAELKQGSLDAETERDHFRMVIHMIGDIHQPLHVGTGDDRGGNDVRVQWQGESSNLHRVWDTDMIESYEVPATDFTQNLPSPSAEQISEWQSATVRDWANESMTYRDNVYDIPEDNQLTLDYRTKNIHIVELRLVQAGVRMAGILNSIYDPEF